MVLRRDLRHPGGPPRAGGPLGFEREVPAPSTVLWGGVDKIPVRFLEGLLATPVRSLVRGRVHAAGDATGFATRQYLQWFALRHGRKVRRRKFVQLHSLLTTRAQGPFFLSVRGTRGTRGDSPELEHLLEGLDPTGELGNRSLDKGYQSRRNATLIENRGGVPALTLKAHATAGALGHPAWKRMVKLQRADGRAYRLRYIRRTGQEGVYGVERRWFWVGSREILSDPPRHFKPDVQISRIRLSRPQGDHPVSTA